MMNHWSEFLASAIWQHRNHYYWSINRPFEWFHLPCEWCLTSFKRENTWNVGVR